MPFTYEKKKWIIVAVWLLISVLSFTVAAKYASARNIIKSNFLAGWKKGYGS